MGIFIFAACLVVAAFSFRITDTPIFRKGTTLITYLDDATGVFKNSKVKMAGIDIGVITGIELEGGKAKISLLINSGIQVPDNAQLIPRPLGILGDKFLEVVVPAPNVVPKETPESPPHSMHRSEKSFWTHIESLFEGNDAHAQDASADKPVEKVIPTVAPSKPAGEYREGQVIKSINSAVTLDDLARQMAGVGTDLKAISTSLRQVVEGKEDQNSPIGKTIRNSEKLTSNLNSLVLENRKDIHETLSSLNRLTSKLEKSFDGFDESQLRKDIKNIGNSAGNISKAADNLEKITSRVERGEGTLGKLVNDPTTVVELNRTLRSVNALVDRAERTLAIVDMNSEYLFVPKTTKTYLGLTILPREDVGYLAQVVVDPMGTTQKVITKTTTDGGPTTTVETITNDRSALRFSIQYYKRLWDLSLRLGLFESRGGLGLDWHLLKDRVLVGAELFDFSREGGQRAHLKAYAKVSFLSYFYAIVGGDELAAKSSNLVANGDPVKSFHAGIGIRFSDEDLKTLSLIPSVR